MSSPYRAPSPGEATPLEKAPQDLLGPRLHFSGTEGYSRSYTIALWVVGLVTWGLLVTFAIAVGEFQLTVAVAVILGVVTLGLVIAGWSPRLVSVALHREGVVVSARSSQQTMLWSDVRWLFYTPLVLGGDLRTRHLGFRLVSEDDRTVVIPAGLLDAERVGWLERRVSAPLVADAKDAFRRGEHLVFGDLTVDRDGLTFRGRSLSWEEVRDVQVVVGAIRIRQRDAITPFATLRLEDVPHPMVFLAVLRERVVVL